MEKAFGIAPIGWLGSLGRILPIQRGAGLHQPGMRLVEEKLRDGDWVNIFPEGTRSKSGRLQLPFKPGVARLIASTEHPAVVLPIYHRGMEHLWPYPMGLAISIQVGRPIMFDDLLRSARQGAEAELHRRILDRLESVFVDMEADMDRQYALDCDRLRQRMTRFFQNARFFAGIPVVGF
jgi:1-acyl-sn-glycerol-3-phosphate acyltransferase